VKATDWMINGIFLEMAQCHDILSSSFLNNVKRHNAESLLDFSALVSPTAVFAGIGIFYCSSDNYGKWT
jgi:hypothetical protein